MSAGNVGYGLPRTSGTPARGSRRALDLVGLGGMAHVASRARSRAASSSACALARAIAPEPSVLLLDEPFSNLDTTLRVQVRTELHHLLVELGITAVFVTHDQEEAFVLGDEVAVMFDGAIVQQAAACRRSTPAPATPWVAQLRRRRQPAPRRRRTAARRHDGHRPGAVARALPTGAVTVLLRPEDLRLAARR